MLFRRYSIWLFACAAIVSCQEVREDKRDRSPVSDPVVDQVTETQEPVQPTAPGQPIKRVQRRSIKKTLTAAELTQMHADIVTQQPSSMRSEIDSFRGKMWLAEFPATDKDCYQYITLKYNTPEVWTIIVCRSENGTEYSVDVALLQSPLSSQPALPMVNNYLTRPLLSSCLSDNHRDPLAQARFALIRGFGAHIADQQFYPEGIAGISGTKGSAKLNEPDALTPFTSCDRLRTTDYQDLSDVDKIHRAACDLIKRETHTLLENDNLMGCFDADLNLTRGNAKLYN